MFWRVVIMAFVLNAAFSSGPQSRCIASSIFLGTVPYSSRADSPFPLNGGSNNFYLEDFEPPANLPPSDLIIGKLAPPGATLEYGSVGAYWSIGEDDPVDGSGRHGWSGAPLFRILTGTESEFDTFNVRFDSQSLGFLPTAVGFVVTQGSPVHTGFSIYTSAGTREDFRLNAIDLSAVPQGSGQFFGVINFEGISRIEIIQSIVYSDPTDQLRFDHFQYGDFVPEPSTTAMLMVVALLCVRNTRFTVLRRRHTHVQISTNETRSCGSFACS